MTKPAQADTVDLNDFFASAVQDVTEPNLTPQLLVAGMLTAAGVVTVWFLAVVPIATGLANAFIAALSN